MAPQSFTQDKPVQEDHADIDARLEAEAQPLHEEGVTKFVSASRLLRLVRIPGYDQALGGALGTQRVNGLVYEFEGGVLRVDDKLHKRDQRFFAGLKKKLSKDEFEDFDTRPAEEWLRDHEQYKVLFHPIDHEPQTPSPNDELVKIAGLAAEGEVEALAELYRAEEAGHDRAPIKEAIIAALNAIEAKQTESG